MARSLNTVRRLVADIDHALFGATTSASLLHDGGLSSGQRTIVFAFVGWMFGVTA